MRDGSFKDVEGTVLREGLHYHKDEETKLFFLTHDKTGKYIASSNRLKEIKELIQEPEFFDDTITLRGLLDAKTRWMNRIYKEIYDKKLTKMKK